MKLIIAAISIAALSAVGLGAQSAEVQSKTKIEVKDGKNVTVTGCLTRTAAGGLVLTDVANADHMRYALVTDDDYSKQIGHRVEVKGVATDNSDGKVKIESTVKTSGEKETRETTETTGDVGAYPFLGVKSLKSIADSCR